ncbi:MAG: glycine cleavage system aminomethyltransferase GcvT [Bacteroidales bacterium]|nr:glycine cleavage system aminomethyltransferase GcvT [Bacteroidales bacterium]MCF8403452.1 glycine cleavage system aminomethyltransferase GcvT [Bacteroidales bacterium]
MKYTAFHSFHEAMGAKMVEFAGYHMPIQYEGLIKEHLAVRNQLGVFDVSHMGEVWVKGPKAESFVQWVTTNDVSSLFDGKVQYSCFPNGKGGIVDDLLVYRFDAETYLLVINAANIDKDWNWLVKNAEEKGLVIGKELINASDDIAQLAIQGPLALKAMQKLTSEPIEGMEYYTFKKLEFAGVKDVILSTTGYTGSGGCEIYINNEDAAKVWKAVFEAGAEFGVKPIGLGARDTLRLEMGFCLYGNDIDDTTSPIEAGLGWITKFTDTNNFIDKELFLKQKEEGVSRRLRAFELIDKGIPRQHYEICDVNGKPIGEVTSGTMGPAVQKGIGMGYIQSAYTKFGTEVYIKIRDRLLKAVVVKLPFYKEA